ncbi:MAG TPA: ATP-binding protein [Vicinamibacterales bacterium]|nr:ATP-binding protein [Vicinamibacterales bacterium]
MASFYKVWHPGLRLRILAPAVLVAVPALALLIYLNVDRRREAELEISANAERLARLAVVDQRRLIEGTRQLLISISQSRDVQEGNLDGCRAYLRQLLPQFGTTYNNIGVVDAGGTINCSGLPSDSVSAADRAWYQLTMSRRMFVIGDYVVGRQSGRASLPFGYPLRGPAGDLRGVVFANVDLQRLNESLFEVEWPSDATLIVTDRNNTVIARHPDWRPWIGRSLVNDPMTTAIGPRLEGTVDVEEHGQMELLAFKKITTPADTGLTVRVVVSKGQAMALANRAMYEGLIALGLVSFLVMVGVKAASDRLLLSPIVQLTKASRSLAAGDLGARAASSTTIPELTALGKDFDDMAAALEEREAARVLAERERKNLEQQYHQSQKMEAVGRLAGGIAHDFNNMLTAILGYCDLLLEDPGTSEAQRADVREIEKAGRTAAALTRQLLAFSRREIIEPAVIDLNAVVGGMDKMLHRLLGENIRVESRLEPRLDRVKADRGQLEQVILNLLVNARDAMPEGGRVLIETANVTLPQGVQSRYLAAPPGQYVALSVTDEGTGIPEQVLPHLFEPFFTTKGTGKGTGLGLATIYGIVKQGGGGIVVQSNVGGGTMFRICLPRTDEALSHTSGTVKIERAPGSKATILVVEDDSGIRELTARVLSRYGYVVLTASGGDEARAVCERHDGAIDLLLSDVVMPGMSGPQVAEMLTALRPQLKVVYMSGYTDDAILRHGVMVRDMPFLQKPFTPQRLHNKILEVLGHSNT